MLKLIIRVVLVSLTLSSCIAYATPIQWKTVDGGNDHYYEAVSSSAHWNTAKVLAEGFSYNGMQGHLVTITSEEENLWIWNHLSPVAGYFLGGTDLDDEGVWQWVTGESWDYVNWNGGEPNNSTWKLGTGEDGLQFASNGSWNDIPVSGYAPGGYIIEYESSATVPEPSTILLIGSGVTVLAGFRRKFRKNK